MKRSMIKSGSPGSVHAAVMDSSFELMEEIRDRPIFFPIFKHFTIIRYRFYSV